VNGVRTFLWRLFAVPRKRQLEADLDDEIQTHLEMQADECVRQGMDPDLARVEAVRRFGRVEHIKDDYRDRRGLPLLEAIARDVRYSLRLLRRSPGFSLIAVLTLAVGIGATTAVFTIVNRAALRPLPVQRPGDLVALSNVGAGMFQGFSYPYYVDLRDRARSFSNLIAYRFSPLSVRASGVNERLWGYLVSGNYFETLGVGAVVGRTITPADDRDRGGHPVAVISYRYWQRRFGGDPAAIGQGILVNGRTYTVIGVAPRGFFGTEIVAAPDLWFPIAMQAEIDSRTRLLDDRRIENLLVIGRLAEHASRSQATAELDAIAADLGRVHPDTSAGRRIVHSPVGLMGNVMREPVFGSVTVLLVVSGVVLLVACTNLANLLLARAIDRRHEIAVRLSLGSGRLPLVRQLLVESLMLSIAAGGAGLLLAASLMQAVALAPLPIDVPLAFDFPIDRRVLLFNVALSVITAVMFGLIPALQGTKANISAVLKDAAGSTERRGVTWRNGLIVVQVALSLVLLTGAGLMWRALAQARRVPLGFSTTGAVEVTFDLRLQGYSDEQGRELQQRLVEHVRSLPGIANAGLADVVPLDLHFTRQRIYHESAMSERDAQATVAYLSKVSPGYFRTMRTRLLEGRDFNELDDDRGASVVVVNRALAAQMWPDATALGQRLRMGRSADSPVVQVVGVVEDGKYGSFNDESRPALFRPLKQSYSGTTSIVARTNGGAGTALAAIRGAVRDVDPNMPIAAARTLDERLAVVLLPARVMAWGLGSFGALALLLSAVGLYGVMSYSVSSRTQEIGIRMALGADRRDLLQMVFGDGGRLVAIGILAGVGLSVFLTRLLRVLLIGVSPTDPATYAAVVLSLVAVGSIACWIPARRALDTDPVDALRST
jgi:predicted permease